MMQRGAIIGGSSSPSPSSSSSSSSGSTDNLVKGDRGGNDNDNLSTMNLAGSASGQSTRSRSPSIIVRTGASVHHHRRRDLPWGIRLIQKISDSCFPNLRVNRDLW